MVVVFVSVCSRIRSFWCWFFRFSWWLGGSFLLCVSMALLFFFMFFLFFIAVKHGKIFIKALKKRREMLMVAVSDMEIITSSLCYFLILKFFVCFRLSDVYTKYLKKFLHVTIFILHYNFY